MWERVGQGEKGGMGAVAADGVDRQDLISLTFHQTLWLCGGFVCLVYPILYRLYLLPVVLTFFYLIHYILLNKP